LGGRSTPILGRLAFWLGCMLAIACAAWISAATWELPPNTSEPANAGAESATIEVTLTAIVKSFEVCNMVISCGRL